MEEYQELGKLADAPQTTWESLGWRKALNLVAQFQPYFLMWYGFFLIVNELVASMCPTDLLNCAVPDPADEGLQPFENTTINRDMFSCPKVSLSKGYMGVLLLLVLLFSAGVMMIQLGFMLYRVRATPYTSLRYVVWLEVAKERGSVFNRCTIVSAFVIAVASVVSFVDFLLSGFEGNVNDLLNVTFQAGASLYTAHYLATYNSPVTTFKHAQACPDIPLTYSWWETSEDVMGALHFILALDEEVTMKLLDEAGGDEKAMEALLESTNLDHNHAGLLAGLGSGRTGRANLKALRQFFSHPPTRRETQNIRRGENLRARASRDDPGVRHTQAILREMRERSTQQCPTCNDRKQAVEPDPPPPLTPPLKHPPPVYYGSEESGVDALQKEVAGLQRMLALVQQQLRERDEELLEARRALNDDSLPPLTMVPTPRRRGGYRNNGSMESIRTPTPPSRPPV